MGNTIPNRKAGEIFLKREVWTLLGEGCPICGGPLMLDWFEEKIGRYL